MLANGKDRAAPTLCGVHMKWVSMLMLVAQTVSVVFAMRWSRTRDEAGPRYLNTTAVFFSELVKLFCSYLFLSYEEGSLYAACKLVWQQLVGDPSELIKVAVPGLLYTVQNNLLFIALSNLSGAVYQVTYQLKILTTALLSVVVLNRRLGQTKWAALLTLTLGVALIQLSQLHGTAGKEEATDLSGSTTLLPASAPEGGSATIGLAAVLSACMTSGLAGVYLEKILKQTSASIWLRNIQLGLMGSLLGLVGAELKDGDRIRAGGFTQGYSKLVWGVILLQAVGGLVVAAVLKYADNILKCFGNALSIALSCLLSAVLLQEFVPDLQFVCGTLLVVWATTLYSLGVPESMQYRWNRCLGGLRKHKHETPQAV